MRTYNEWLLEGRVPAAGEKAEHYAVNADRTRGVAVFREDQTTPIEPRPAECTVLVTREEWDAVPLAQRRRKTAKPVARVRKNERGAYEIWVGNNKDVIAHLRKNGWVFNSRVHRWVAKLDTHVSNVVTALEKLGCTVTVEDAV